MNTPKDYFKKMGLESGVEVQALTGFSRRHLYGVFETDRHRFNCILISAQKVKQTITKRELLREELKIATQEFVENGGDIEKVKMGVVSKCE
jgi:hypothetical protein